MDDAVEPADLSALDAAVRENDQDALRVFEARLEGQSSEASCGALSDAFRVGPAHVRMWALSYASQRQLSVTSDLGRAALRDANVDVRSEGIRVVSDGDPDEACALLEPIVTDELGGGNTLQALWAMVRHRLGTPGEVRHFARGQPSRTSTTNSLSSSRHTSRTTSRGSVRCSERHRIASGQRRSWRAWVRATH